LYGFVSSILSDCCDPCKALGFQIILSISVKNLLTIFYNDTTKYLTIIARIVIVIKSKWIGLSVEHKKRYSAC
jgi:hypothetical protein